MLKKIILYISIILLLNPLIIKASSNIAASINGKYYENLEEAINAAGKNETINLLSNINLPEAIRITKKVNINLNNNDISSNDTVFLIQGGELNLRGTGTIKENNPYYGAIKVIGNKINNNEKYSIVNIEKGVKLEGWSGIFVSHDSSKSYGVEINFDGQINGISDKDGGLGIGIYINGNIKDKENSPTINIYDNAKITSNGEGIYIGGYTTVNIKKAHIEGKEAGIGIKSGILNINGATIKCSGKDSTPTEGFNDGIKSSGTTLQIESNTGYAGNIEIKIEDGEFISKNSNVIYEYIGKGNTTQVKEFDVKGGTFISEANKNVFLLSNSFESKHPKFITGGTYSSDPSNYLETEYNSIKDNNLYIITKSTMKEISLTKNSKKNTNKKTLLILILTAILGVFLYKNNIIKNTLKKITNKYF